MLVKLRALLRRRRTDRELDDELAYHLDREVERHLAAGMRAEDARDAARRAFGNVGLARELARDTFTWSWVEQARQDARYAVRSLRRSPAFTAVAVLSLGLGIGANTAIFGLMYRVLFKPLPLPHPEQLASLARITPDGPDNSFSWTEYLALRGAPGLAGMTAVRDADHMSVGPAERREYTTLDLVDGAFFPTVGVTPLLGRGITEDDVARAAPVAVVARRFWERSLASDPQVVGRTLLLHDVPVTIVGVLPESFRGLDYPGWFKLAVPITLAPALGLPDYVHLDRRRLGLVARLPAEAGAARAALDAAFQRCCAHDEHDPQQRAAVPAGERLSLVEMRNGIGGGKDDVRRDLTPLLFAMMGGVAVVLLIACANVANLLIVRAAARERELGVRMALGASRGRLIRQLIAESVLLAAPGAVLGFALAGWGTVLLTRWLPDGFEEFADVMRFHAEPVLLLFTAAVSLGCVLLFGTVPALRATRSGDLGGLRGGQRSHTRADRGLLERAGVAAQVALALILISAAGLLVATLRNLARETGGFRTQDAFLAAVETRGTPYEPAGAGPMQEEILRRVRALPGVAEAGMATLVPMFGGRNATARLAAGDGSAAGPEFTFDVVTPGFLGAAGIALLQGRDFGASDVAGGERVAIVSAGLARRLATGGAVVGSTLKTAGEQPGIRRVVGVATDIRAMDLRREPLPMVYLPVAQAGRLDFLELVAHTRPGAAGLASRIAAEIHAVAPGVRVRRVSDMRAEVAANLVRERLAASLATLFGVLALGLAAMGLYGIVAYRVARREREIGVRMALGAGRADVALLVAKQSLVMVGVGVAAGAPLALAAGKAIGGQLYGIAGTDPSLLGLAALVLLAVAAAATAIPAWRAVRIEPLVALRAD